MKEYQYDHALNNLKMATKYISYSLLKILLSYYSRSPESMSIKSKNEAFNRVSKYTMSWSQSPKELYSEVSYSKYWCSLSEKSKFCRIKKSKHCYSYREVSNTDKYIMMLSCSKLHKIILWSLPVDNSNCYIEKS